MLHIIFQHNILILAMIGRIISGLLTGNLAVLKSYVMEITDETNRGKGFIYLHYVDKKIISYLILH